MDFQMNQYHCLFHRNIVNTTMPSVMQFSLNIRTLCGTLSYTSLPTSVQPFTSDSLKHNTKNEGKKEERHKDIRERAPFLLSIEYKIKKWSSLSFYASFYNHYMYLYTTYTMAIKHTRNCHNHVLSITTDLTHTTSQLHTLIELSPCPCITLHYTVPTLRCITPRGVVPRPPVNL